MFAGLFFVLPYVSLAHGAAPQVRIFSGQEEHRLSDGHGGYLIITFNWSGQQSLRTTSTNHSMLRLRLPIILGTGRSCGSTGLRHMWRVT
jgi:hypothetical protein